MRVKPLGTVTKEDAPLVLGVETVDRMTIARRSATAILEDVLGARSSVTRPYFEDAYFPMVAAIVGRRGGSVQFSRSEVADVVRAANPKISELVSKALDVTYLARSSGLGGHTGAYAYVGPETVSIGEDSATALRFHEKRSVLGEQILNHFQEITGGAIREGGLERRHAVALGAALPRSKEGEELFLEVTGADIARFVIQRFPDLLREPLETDLATPAATPEGLTNLAVKQSPGRSLPSLSL